MTPPPITTTSADSSLIDRVRNARGGGSCRGREAVSAERRHVERRPPVAEPLREQTPDDGTDGEAVATEAGRDVRASLDEAVDDRHLVRRQPLEADPAPSQLRSPQDGQHLQDRKSVV